jgi:hypothetical protein
MPMRRHLMDQPVSPRAISHCRRTGSVHEPTFHPMGTWPVISLNVIVHAMMA